MNHYMYLGIAVLADAMGASALKSADGLRVPFPSFLALLGYGTAFFCLALAVRTMPISIANALWSGLSIAAVAVVGYIVHRQALDRAAVMGLVLIFAGIAVFQWSSLVTRS